MKPILPNGAINKKAYYQDMERNLLWRNLLSNVFRRKRIKITKKLQGLSKMKGEL